MVNVTFMMHVNVWRNDLYINVKDHKDSIIEWFTEMNQDQKNFKIEYVISNVFKITYDIEDDEEERCMMETVADPDDDGNYPLKIKGYYYLVSGKVIDNTISQK